MSLRDEAINFFGFEQQNEAPKKCLHVQSDIPGVMICSLCGFEIKRIDFEAEWRYYDDTKDPSRCHKQKDSTKQKESIDKIFQDVRLGSVPDVVRRDVGKRYETIVDGETVRGKKRRGIAAACFLYICRESGEVWTAEEVAEKFNITQKEMSVGITRYLEKFQDARSSCPTVKDTIPRILKRIGVDEGDLDEVQTLVESLENRSATLNHSGPQSVAAAIIYLYLCIHPEKLKARGITRSAIAMKSGISEITLIKLATVAANVLNLGPEILIKS